MTTINQNMIAIVHGYPNPICSSNSLSHVVTTSFVIPTHDEATLRAIEADGMKHWWYIPHPPVSGNLITRSVSETIALAESIGRKMIPHIAETLHLTESIRRRMTPKITGETLQLSESIRRRMIPHITGETLTLSESVKRRIIPHIVETLHLAETILRKIIPKITGETLHLTESFLRRMIPHISETLTLAESIKKKVFKPISETLHLVESDTRKMIPHITAETIHLAESFLRKIIPHITETLTLAESVKKKVVKLIPQFLLYDNFESGTYTYSAEPQASPNNLWTVQFRGGGTAGVHTPTSSTDTTLVAFQTPQTATNSGQTFSALVTTNSNYTDFTLEFDVRTIAQLRTGSAPNNWEVAWVFWHWTDNNHQYYFAPKMSGVELGKKDTGGTQIILDTPGTAFTNTLGTWYHVKLVTVGNHFKTWINGTLYNDYVDTGVGGFPSASNFAPSSALYSGKVGMYCEDSQVEFDNISITPTEGFFLGEPEPLQFPIRLIPHIIGETLHLAESFIRKMIPKISETLHLAESVLRKMIPKITETLTLTESISAHKIFKKAVSETLALSESVRRKMIPHIAETLTLSESVKKKVFHPISETLHLSDSFLRKMIPHIAGETLHLSESTLRKVIRPVSETLHLSESTLRKVIPKISETLHLSESFLRKIIPKISETLHLAESISAIKGGATVENISETLHLAESEIRKMVPRIGCQLYRVTVAEGITLSESVLRKSKPSIIESLHLSEVTRRRTIPHITETITLVESVRRRIIPHIAETIHLADIIKIGGQFVIMIHETLTLSESVLMKQKPHIASETLHLAESILRKIPHNFAETLTLSESTRKKIVKSIRETINTTECHVYDIVGHGMHVFQFIFHDKWKENPPKKYTINVEESIKLDEKIEIDQSGPSYLWKLVPWRRK